MKAPLCSPSIDVWLSWQPEMRITVGLNGDDARQSPARGDLSEPNIGIDDGLAGRGGDVLLQLVVERLVLAMGAHRHRLASLGPLAGFVVGGIIASRVTVPLWQLSERTRMRTPSPKRPSSK